MRRTLSLASLLLMGAAVALAGEERSLPLPSPEFLDSLMRESDERVSPYIVGGEVSEQETHSRVYRKGMGAGRLAARMYDPSTHTLYTHPRALLGCGTRAIPLHDVHVEQVPSSLHVVAHRGRLGARGTCAAFLVESPTPIASSFHLGTVSTHACFPLPPT